MDLDLQIAKEVIGDLEERIDELQKEKQEIIEAIREVICLLTEIKGAIEEDIKRIVMEGIDISKILKEREEKQWIN